MNPPPPVTTPFWIGQTVYKKYGGRSHGIVTAVMFEGDPAHPQVSYRVAWPKTEEVTFYFGLELQSKRPDKKSFRQ